MWPVLLKARTVEGCVPRSRVFARIMHNRKLAQSVHTKSPCLGRRNWTDYKARQGLLGFLFFLFLILKISKPMGLASYLAMALYKSNTPRLYILVVKTWGPGVDG